MATEWLSSQAYNKALKALSSHEYTTSIDPDKARQLYFNDYWLLETDLRRFNCQPLPTPEYIQGIDNIQNQQAPIVGKPFFIELLGMPRAGKDTLRELIQSQKPSNIIFTYEPYSQAINHSNNISTRCTQEELIQAITIAELTSGQVKARKSKHEDESVVMLPRSLTNLQIFSRMNFLIGKTHPSRYNQISTPASWLKNRGTDNEAQVFMFITPEECQRRNPISFNTKLHQSLEARELTYEINLIAYHRLIELEAPNIIALNMMGTIDENFAKFNSVMRQLLGTRYSIT